MDKTFQQAITASVEKIVNGALAYDPATKNKISAIRDVLAVKITAPVTCTIYLCGQTEGLAALSYYEPAPTTTLTGSTSAFIRLLQHPEAFTASDVSLTGSPQLLQQWQAIIETLDIDWEDALSKVLGDIAGPAVNQALHQSAQWLHTQASEQERLITEYLSEERQLVPSKAEVGQFSDNVAALRLQMDRISARTERLSQAIHTPIKHSL
ncbi:ubiquinone biosynthesis accessory factor UbiJ [Eionea flava]